MFEIKDAPWPGAGKSEKIVIDEERDVCLQFVSGFGHGTQGMVFKLVWGDRTIPFEMVRGNAFKDLHLPADAPWQQTVDRDGKKLILVWKFKTFGGSTHGRMSGGPPDYQFKDEDERHQAILLAVEAAIAFGGFYDGCDRPDGAVRVNLPSFFWHEGDKTNYIKSDFEAGSQD